MPPDEAAVVAPEPHRSRVEAFAGEIRRLAEQERRGDLAALRRLDPEQPDAAAFFRSVVKIAPDAGPGLMRRYARLLRMLALKPDALKGGSLGAALANAGVSESRVLKLLAARGPALARQLDIIARRLANAGDLPYREIGRLTLEPDDSEHAEDARLRVARDYWRGLDSHKADRAPNPDSQA
jgi:CRISPR system Cascade subunit CasB